MTEDEYEIEIRLRRYENDVKRQQHFMDFCRLTFNFYVKVTGWVCAAVAALISYSFRVKDNGGTPIPEEVISAILDGSVIIVTILGLLSTFQILFALSRWYGYRRKEQELTCNAVKVEWWAFLLESGYVVAILISIYLYRTGISIFSNVQL